MCFKVLVLCEIDVSLLPELCFLNISLSPERLTVKFVTLDAGALSIAAMPKGCAADLFTSKNQKLFSKKKIPIKKSIAVLEIENYTD